jgi:uncharacterized membrane protein
MQDLDLTENVGLGWPMGFNIFIASFVIIFVGMLFMMLASVSPGSATSGLFVFIGPFPVAIGAGSQSSFVIALVFALAILGMVFFFLFTRRRSVSRL